MSRHVQVASIRAARPLSRGGLVVWGLALLLSGASLVVSPSPSHGAHTRQTGDTTTAMSSHALHAPPPMAFAPRTSAPIRH